MLRGPTRSMATARVFLQMWMFGEDKARKMSIMISCTTFEWCFFSSDRRSRTMSLTLLSLEEFSNAAYVCAQALTAVGAVDRETSDQAAS